MSPPWRGTLGGAARAVRERPRLWLLIALGTVAAYLVGLQAAMVLRFGNLPNYWTAYDLFGNYGLILAGTPAWSDAVNIMADEPLLEIGYLIPEYGIAEWSLFILPPKLLMVAALGLLVATYVVTAMRPRGAACALPGRLDSSAAAGVGGLLVGTANATLTWVVCCATPSWVVVLSMLGVGTSLALALEPLGTALNVAGLLVLCGATLLQAHRRAHALRAAAPVANSEAPVAPQPTPLYRRPG